jgi:alpha-D-ribose 1-methylphosphonate 5-triphosphate synthase subunit PhnL
MVDDFMADLDAVIRDPVLRLIEEAGQLGATTIITFHVLVAGKSLFDRQARVVELVSTSAA